MPDEMIPTYDEEYTLILKGYDVVLMPSDQGPGYFWVKLFEGGEEVFAEDIPMPEVQPGETEEDSIENTAQAAIDIFEASRGTLGEGAGAEMTANVNKPVGKTSFCLSYGHEEWFMSFKGTPYEDTAYNLLKNYYSIDLEQSGQDDAVLALYDRQTEIEYELKMLDLERMKNMPANAQIIIIQANRKKAWIGEYEEYEEFLAKFCGDPLEGKVVNLMSELLDVKQQIRKNQEGLDSFWDERRDIENQMEALSEEALQANVLSKIPTEGIEAFPNMAGEVAELMEGVSMDEPLEPMSVLTARKAQMTPVEESDEIYAEEWEPVEDRIDDLGEVHEGLDPAETEQDLSFSDGDRVKLKKKLEVPGQLNGIKRTFESGALGYVDSLYDRHGDYYMVSFDNGGLVKVPADHLSKAKK